MEWWVWLVIVVVTIAALFGAFVALQAKRRSGGVRTTDRRGQ